MKPARILLLGGAIILCVMGSLFVFGILLYFSGVIFPTITDNGLHLTRFVTQMILSLLGALCSLLFLLKFVFRKFKIIHHQQSLQNLYGSD